MTVGPAAFADWTSVPRSHFEPLRVLPRLAAPGALARPWCRAGWPGKRETQELCFGGERYVNSRWVKKLVPEPRLNNLRTQARPAAQRTLAAIPINVPANAKNSAVTPCPTGTITAARTSSRVSAFSSLTRA